MKLSIATMVAIGAGTASAFAPASPLATSSAARRRPRRELFSYQDPYYGQQQQDSYYGQQQEQDPYYAQEQQQYGNQQQYGDQNQAGYGQQDQQSYSEYMQASYDNPNPEAGQLQFRVGDVIQVVCSQLSLVYKSNQMAIPSNTRPTGHWQTRSRSNHPCVVCT